MRAPASATATRSTEECSQRNFPCRRKPALQSRLEGKGLPKQPAFQPFPDLQQASERLRTYEVTRPHDVSAEALSIQQSFESNQDQGAGRSDPSG